MIAIGINYSQMHDSSACIARDGEVLFAVAEERLSRVKHDARFPVLAIRACLDFAGARAEKPGFCLPGMAPQPPLWHDLKCMATGSQPIDYVSLVSTVRRNVGITRQGSGQKPFLRAFGRTRARFRFVDHHLAHAISAYAFSGFDEAAVLVLDGRGAWEATSLWHGRDGRLEHIWTIPWPNSLGLFYAQFTQYLGFQPYSDEWKVMGLAPYGEPGINLREFIVPDDNPYRVAARLLMGTQFGARSRQSKRNLGRSEFRNPRSTTRHKNLAFAVQDACERAMMTLARAAVEKTGCRNLCLAGGVALNSKANGKILASGIVDRIFVQPASRRRRRMPGGGARSISRRRRQTAGAPDASCVLGPGKRRFRDSKSSGDIQVARCAASAIRREPPPKCSRTAKLWAGFRAGWNLGRARWATVRFSPIRAIRK